MPFVRAGVPADVVSLAGVPLAVGSALAVFSGCPLTGLVLGSAAALTDFIDGDVARLQEKATAFGSVLEATIDRFVDAALLAGLVGRYPLAAVSALVLGTLAPYIKARVGLVMPSDNRDWPGVGDRTDRVVLVLVAILLSAFTDAGAELVLWTVAAISATGAVQRMLHARRLIADAEREGRLLEE